MAGDAETGLEGFGWSGAGSDKPRAENDARFWFRLAAKSARVLTDGPVGGVVAQLRARARKADRRAGWFLGALMLTILGGFAYCVGWPLFTQIVDGTRQIWEAQIDIADAEAARFDARRNEAEKLLAELLEFAPRTVRVRTKEQLDRLVLVADKTLVAIGQLGAILISQDGGQSRGVPNVGLEEDFGTPVELPDGTIVVMGSSRTILRSEDNGQGWEVRAGSKDKGYATPTPASSQDNSQDRAKAKTRGDERFGPLVVVAEGTVVAMGSSGKILRSEDDGRNWSALRGGSGVRPSGWTDWAARD